MQLLTFILSSIAFVTAVQGATPQLCCPKSVLKSPYPVNDGARTNLKGASLDSDGNLVCSYEGKGIEGLENPFCKYTPVPREVPWQPFGVKTTRIAQPGEAIGGGELGCDRMSPAKGTGTGACTSSFCCPSQVFGALTKATYQKKGSSDTFWCAYEGGSGCEYYADSGSLTFTYYHGACPRSAVTGKTCVIDQ